MQKIGILFFALLLILIVTSNSVVATSGNPTGPTDTLYRFPFKKQSGYSLTEVSDHSILILWKGDESNAGKIIRFEPSTKRYTEILQFGGQSGTEPCLRVVFDEKTNLLYGTTARGGRNGSGTLYAFNYKTKEYSTLFDFADSSVCAGPNLGLIRLNENVLVGLCGTRDSLRIFTFNMQTKKADLFQPPLEKYESMSLTMPAVISPGRIVYLTELFVDTTSKPRFVVCDVLSKKVLSVAQSKFEFDPACGLLSTGDSCAYISNYFGGGWFEPAPDPDFCFVKFDSRTNSITSFQTPPHEVTVWGPPMGLSSDGDLIGAFLYGGKDNAGYVFRYDLQKDTMFIVKEWKDTDPGCMTDDTELLHHSNGFYYGFSFVGGKDGEGRFFSLDPASGKAEELADFIPW